MSPLEPGEIGRAKLYGSLHALRYMAGAMILAWTLGVILGAIPLRAYVTWIAGTAAGCALLAAVGVRASLSLPSATKAMTWTMSLWLAGQALVGFLAFSAIALGFLCCIAAWSAAIRYYLIPLRTPPWFPMSFSTGWALASDLVTLLITVLIVADTALRFDRIAGRMAGGRVAATVDAWLHGRARRPVLLPARQRPMHQDSSAAATEPLVTAPGVASLPEA
jgi:hypothetical protein